MLEYRTNPRVEAIESLSEMSIFVRSPSVDVVASAICVGVNPKYSACVVNKLYSESEQTSSVEVLLEVGDPVAVERVDRRRVQIIGRQVCQALCRSPRPSVRTVFV